MQREVKEWRIHVGAHKAATTHLQTMLSALRGTLAAQDIDFLPLRVVRPALTPVLKDAVARPSGVARWMQGYGRRRQQDIFLQTLQSLRQADVDRVVVSEENLIGEAYELLMHPVYPRLERRLQLCRGLSRRAPLKLFLSIRSFDRVLPGAYTTALRYRYMRRRPDLLPKLQTNLDRRPPSWIDIIDRIRKAVPEAEVRVWRLEDYARTPESVVSAFTGARLSELPQIDRPQSTVTPSAAAVTEVEEMCRTAPPDISAKAWERTVNGIYARKTATDGAAKYTFLTPDQIARLQARYEEDIDLIERRFPQMLIASQMVS